MKKFKNKKYTVNLKETVEEDGKKYKVFKNLVKAREFAREQFRANNFVSLNNFKRVILPI